MPISKHIISQAHVSGEEVFQLCSTLAPFLEDTSQALAIVSLISLTLTAMDPDITDDTLTDGVRQVSEFICLYLEGKDAEMGGGVQGMVN